MRVFLYLLLADSEERRLQKEFEEEYSSYRSRVPFILPFIPPSSFRLLNRILPTGRWKRIAVFLGICVLIIGLSINYFWGRTVSYEELVK